MANRRPRPRTGERRKTHQPLKIDRLPVEVRDAIQRLKAQGRTWQEIEDLSAQADGFVKWNDLDAAVRRLFPDKKLPVTTLHRWYDLRVQQVMAEVEARSATARELAAAFARSVVDGEDDAVLNAARDQLMSILAEDMTPQGRIAATRGLIALAEMMQERRANEIKERKVAIDERRLVQLEKDAEMKRRRFQREMDAAEKKITRGKALTAQDIDRIRERVFGIGPKQTA